jgi:hypothetical protein
MRAIHAAISVVAMATLGAAVIGGCSGGSAALTAPPGSSSGSGGNPTPAPASNATANGTVAATVMDVKLGSGADTGSHRATSSSVTCTYGLSTTGEDAEDALGNQFADDSSSGLSALELLVPDAKVASTEGTDAFMLTVRIGKPTKAHRYRVNSLPESYGVGKEAGSGMVTFDDRGAVGIVSIRGKTADGVTIDATIRCNRILDGDGQPRE